MSEDKKKDEGKVIPLFPPQEPQKFSLTIGLHPGTNSVSVAFEEPISGFSLRHADAERFAKTILANLSYFEKPFHKTALPLPVEEDKRKTMIEWIMEHPLWHYPITFRVPPDPEGFFGPSEDQEGRTVYPILSDGPDWHDETHNIGGGFHECVKVTFHHVDPDLEYIHDPISEGEDDPRNTATRVWIEAGGWYDLSQDKNEIEPEEGWNERNRWGHCHDMNLDCGGVDWETAVLELARLVGFFYNEDGTKKEDAPEPCEGHFEGDDWVSDCEDDGDGFCKHCGFSMKWNESDDS